MAEVQVFAPDGTYGTVDEKDLAGVEAAGGRVASKDEVLDQLPAVTGSKALDFALSLTPQQQAGAQGVMSGATLGFGQVGIKKLLDVVGPKDSGQKYVDYNKRITEAYPGMTTAGEVTGIAASALLGNEAGLARILPGAMVARAGAGAEALVGGGLSRVLGTGLAREVFRDGAKLAARGAMEGALYGGGTEVSSQLLGEPEMAADKIFAAMGHGAIGGAAGGFALGAGARLGSAATKAIGTAVEGKLSAVLSKAADVTETQGTKGLAELANKATKAASEEQAWKALSPLKKYSELAEARMPGGTKGVGEVLLRHGVIDTEAGILKAGLNATPEKMLPRIQAAKELVGKKLGDITSTSPAKVTVQELDRVLTEVVEPLSKKAGFEQITRSVTQYGQDLAAHLGVTPGTSLQQKIPVGKLLEQRKALDELVFKEAKALDPNLRVGALRDIRAKLEGLIVDSIDDAAKQAGRSGLGDELRALKRDYQGLSIAEEATETTASRMVTNRNFSLSAYQAGGGVAAGLSSTLGVMAPAAGFAAGVGHQFVKDRGNAMAAVALSRLAATETLGKMIQSVDAQVARSARGLLSPTAKAAASASSRTKKASAEPPRVRAQAAINEVAEATANPDAYAKRVEDRLRPVRDVSPDVANQLAMSSARALGFLASRLPPQFARGPLDTSSPASRITDQNAQKFLRYYNAVNDPMQAFRAMERGTLNRETVEALRITQPKLFADLQAQAFEHVAKQKESGKPVPYDRRIGLSLLLDVSLDPSLQPQKLRFLQQNVASSPDPGQPETSPPAGPKRPLSLPAETQQSPLDKLEME